jgi:DNA polymerase-3 subunit epsilon
VRQIILDTETTGLETREGHRIIEIGCVELLNRRLTGNHYHQYLQPERASDESAIEVHGITDEFLADKPLFASVAAEFLDFIKGAELIIHNAPFDIGFINYELSLLGPQWGKVLDHCTVLDTLDMARKMHPGQRNSLDALCKRYDIDNASRTLHGALLDSEILADVYLAMTGGQTLLLLDAEQDDAGNRQEVIRPLSQDRPPLRVISASADELVSHESYMNLVDTSAGGQSLWRMLESDTVQ